MIFGIGTDIVQISRMMMLLERYGERFPQRILTSDEFKEFLLDKRPAHFLAKRFAAKEAAAKALGTGFRSGLQLRHIGVSHTKMGQPFLKWLGQADELIQFLGIDRALLSLADEKDYAVAFVTLLIGDSKKTKSLNLNPVEQI
ncbi:holo-acyl-carrier-protein synthase [Candidatus Nitrosoglobus terrae]|uniref:Holo-[acyl-carrier-protein] synthase n=1 Tax=Candidatus Nitrosoglobus terrae TaxID=1630141 RepID=A0A1Q2SLT5_9GAMM|nr:holo-acyl-carrier-protein synthase [Candidatus Nitrosoglobus terrae]